MSNKPHANPSEFLKIALEATHIAEEIITHYYSRGVSPESKADGTPVTLADTEAEKAIIETISAQFPDHGFLAEESGETNSECPYVWIVDPIDGTKNYIRHIPLFATQIALMKDNRPVLGVSNSPMLKELLYAEKNCGAFMNNQSINVTRISKIPNAMICHGDLKYFDEKGILANLRNLIHDAYRSRGYGDFYMYHLLASGRADIVIEAAIKIWDIAALAIIVEEAGGMITDTRANPICQSTNSIVATNGILHQQILTHFKP